MERLILLLLSPAIFAERHKINDPNDEPFLPIHPVYPYNPKLIKRGADRELLSQLSSELYAPRADAKDTYSSSYSNQRNSYYTPNYNPYAKDTSSFSSSSSSSSSSASSYPSLYYGGDAYVNANSPYAAYAPYSAPYAAYPATYPEYYYQPSYYYPHYFNPALYQPPQSPSSGVDYRETSSQDTASSVGTEDADKRDKNDDDDDDDDDDGGKKPKEDGTNRDALSGQFVDGGNYISGGTRDLDVQSSTYKTASPYNQLERDVQTKNSGASVPLPRTTYRVISVAGQPVGPDYPLPAAYVRAQQAEQLTTSQTLAGLLAQGAQQPQTGGSGQSDETAGGDVASGANSGGSYGVSYANQDAYDETPNAPSYVTLPAVRTKTGVAYVINADGIFKVNGERAGALHPHASSSALSSSSSSSSPRASNARSKNAKYTSVLYPRKPAATRTIASHPQATSYVLPSGQRDPATDLRPADRQADATGYEAGYDPSQGHHGGGVSGQSANKQDHQSTQTAVYRDKEFANAPQTPRSYTYQYSAYEADQTTTAQQRPQQDQVVDASDDGDFGAKRYNKG